MKILLVVKSKVMENLGVMYLSAVVKKAKHQCKIVSFDEARVMAKIWNPDVIGYSIMTGDQHRFRILNEKIRERRAVGNNPQIIVGGPHPTFFPDDCEWAQIVPGEAEGFMAELCGLDLPPGIDSIPWPDRSDFPNMKIRDFISSRGCPYDCAYCYNDKWAKIITSPSPYRVRTRSVKDVIAEIVSVSPEFVYFQDSCFGVNPKWMRDFSTRYRSEYNAPYHCHLRPAQVTEERTLQLHDSNCYSLRIALETASTRLRGLINRGNTTNEETLQAARYLRKWNIMLMIQNILGLPTSTIEDDLETLEINIRCKPAYGWCSIFQPYPGTKLGDMCKEKGWYKGDYSEISDSFFDESVLEFDDEHKEQLVCLQRVFALCVETGYMPTVEELLRDNFPKLVHKIMRRLGDNRMYGGVI